MSLLLNPFVFAGAAPSLPVTTNLLAWHSADVASSLTVSSGRVSQWDDLSGNANHLIQPTGSLQPATTTLNGRVALSMGNRLYTMYYSSPVSFNAYSLFIAFRIDENATSSSSANSLTYPDTLGTLGNGGLRIGGNFSAAWSNEVTTWWHFSNSPNFINGYANTSTYTSGTTYILSTTWDNSGTAQIRRDNTALSLNTAASTGGYTGGGFTSTASPKDITYIAGTGTGTPSFNGVVAEIIIYSSSLSSADVDTLNTYLAGKWS